MLQRLSSLLQDGVVPGVKCANQIMDAFASTGNMHSAVDVLETIVAAGVVPQSGTVAALIGGCQRRNSYELAFQVCVHCASTYCVCFDVSSLVWSSSQQIIVT